MRSCLRGYSNIPPVEYFLELKQSWDGDSRHSILSLRARCSVMTFQNKVAIVTGGASGIGRAMCEEFARRGATVAVADIHFSKAEEVAAGRPRLPLHAHLVRHGSLPLPANSTTSLWAKQTPRPSAVSRIYPSKIRRGFPTSMVSSCSSVTPSRFKAGITSL
jgi:hypothetical protein